MYLGSLVQSFEASQDCIFDIFNGLFLSTIDDLGTPSPDDDNIRASCETDNGKAYPPRRIVEVAQGFGENGMVQSICQEDLAGPMSTILRSIGRRLGTPEL